MSKPQKVKINVSAGAKILVVPDMHFPFESKILVEKVYGLMKKLKPTHVIQVGDLVDAYCFSTFTKSANVMTPLDEINKAIKKASSFWQSVRRIVPKTICYQLVGNHDQRIFKYMLRQAPSLEALVEPQIKNLFSFKGVISLGHEKDELVVNSPEWGSLVFIHGFLSKSGDHMRYFLKSVGRGHSHGASVTFLRRDNKTLFELESGCLIDVESPAFEYKHTATSKWIPAVGYIDTLGPRVIPL